MGAKGDEPLTGEAAWKAAKERIAKNNEAAYARGRQERAARDAASARLRLAAEREEIASRPGSRKAR
jgi:hypothetical protein